MRKPPENTSRRNTRRASHQVNIEQESRSGDESTDYGKHRDDNSYTTLQSTRDTSVTLSTTGKVHQAASGRSATALIFGPATGSRGEAEQFLGQLGPTCEYFLAEWENSLQSVDFLDFDPQGELVGAREPQFQSDYSFPAFPTPSSCLSWARSAVETSWTTTTTLPPQLASADPCIDYAAPVPSSMAGMKRKADSDSSVVPTTSSSGSSAKRQSIAGKPESSKTAAMRGPATTQTALSPEETTHIDQTPREEDIPRPSEATSDLPNASRSRKIAEISARLNPVLPAGKVFPIRIGSDLFQLSGASISSDAPSYFSHYFGEQLLQTGGKSSAVKTLYIDRDPATFRDIALHLQGYHITPTDGAHYVRLFADAQFYSLPRLTQQLFKSEIFIQVGERHFQIHRDIFSTPGDLPNYFSLGFAHFFSTPTEAFPGLDGPGLLRPPSILPPAVPNRNGDIFADLLRILQGYDVHVRDEAHRKELLRDARYFHLKGVEQKLLPCHISYNHFRDRSEIAMRLEDLRQSGVSVTPDADSPASARDGISASKPATPQSTYGAGIDGPTGFVSYQRPFVDEVARELIIEISDAESTQIDVATMRATFHGQTKARITSLFQVIANKMNLPATLPLGLMLMQSGGGVAAQPISPANSGISGDRVKVRITRDTHIELDGEVLHWSSEGDNEAEEDQLPRLQGDAELESSNDWIVRRGLWRLRVQSAEDTGRTEVVMCVVKMEACTDERARNGTREFLS